MRVTQGTAASPGSRAAIISLLVLAAFVVFWLQLRWMKGVEGSFERSPISTVTSIIDSQTLRVFCDHCESTGVIRDPSDPDLIEVCPVCFGLGQHKLRQLGQHDMLCPDCGGMGRRAGDVHGEADLCRLCDGRGMVAVSREIFQITAQKALCPHCGGRGVVRNEENTSTLDMCAVCFGLGHHFVRRMDGYDDFCLKCEGMGRYIDGDTGQGQWCEECGGRGLVLSRALHEDGRDDEVE